MTRIIIKEFIWDEYNLEHIRKHNVSQEEVEAVAKNIVTHKKAKKGRYVIIGRVGTRMLSVIINRKKTGIYTSHKLHFGQFDIFTKKFHTKSPP